MEESMGSGAAAIVVGCLDAVALTPARRLALAAGAHRTPALMVTSARTAAMASTSARWRIATAPSAPHPFDPAAPGDPRFALTLERCRGTAVSALSPSSLVEWSYDARCFRVAAGMAVVVDAPASGHSLPLLSAPATLTALARVGPIAATLTRIARRLRDPARTAVWIVTRAEELPVAETIELHRELDGRLALPVARPIVNGVPNRRFSAHDAALLETLGAPASDPLLFAAALTIARRREATAQLRVLRRALPHPPVRLPLLHEEDDGHTLERLTREIAGATGLVA
jgi:hypothetical protein